MRATDLEERTLAAPGPGSWQADTNAVVAWSANLQTQLKTSFKAGALIGRGSGEALQVSFYGEGFVIVQRSEGIQIPTQ